MIIRSVIGLLLIVTRLVVAQEPQEKIDFDYGERLYKEGLFDLAVLQFQNFVEDYPTSPHAAMAQFYLAESFFSLKDFDEAQKAFLRLILRYSSSSFADHAQFRIGECFEKMGKIEEAIVSYFRVYNFYPDSRWIAESLYRSSKLSMEKRRYLKAESLLRFLLELKPTGEFRSKASILLAQVYSQKQEYEKAIQTLHTFLERRIREVDRVEATFLLAENFEALGYWNDSEEQYRNVVKLASNNEFIQKAWFCLGRLYKMEGKEAEAIDAFQKAAELGKDEGVKSRAFFSLGEMKKKQGDFQAGYQAFKAAENQSIDSKEKAAARLEKTQCLVELGKIPQAVTEYKNIIKDSSGKLLVLKRSLLSLANFSVETKNFEEAVNCYNQYLDLFPEDCLKSAVLLKKGKIYLQNLGIWDEGFQIIRQIWSEDPTSYFVPEARFVYAEGLENIGEIEKACRTYQTVFRMYTGTQWAKKACERLKMIELYQLGNYEEGLSKLASLVQRSLLGQANPDFLFELGMVFFQDLKKYRNAVDYFYHYLSECSDSTKKNNVLFHIGESYEALYYKEGTPALLDSAKEIYTRVVLDSSDSLLALDAGLRLAQWESEVSPVAGLKMYSEILDRYPRNDRKDEILYQMGCLTLESDSLSQSLMYFQKLLNNFPDSRFIEEALYQRGKILFVREDFAAADSVFEIYVERFPEARFRSEILFYQAKIAMKREAYKTAISLLESSDLCYFFSPWSDSGRVCLGELYLRNGVYSKAVELYKKGLEEDSLQTWSASVGLRERWISRKKVFLSGLARAYQELRQYKEAKRCYFKYGQEYRHSEDRVVVFSALARIEEDEGNFFRAVNYLTKIVQEIPSDSLFEFLGLLRFRLGQYEDAVAAFDRALNLSQLTEKQAFFSSRIIVSLLCQDKIPQAEVRMKIFEKSFTANPRFQEYLAEFALEKGKAYLRKKEFDPALESFQKVVRKFRETKFAPEAELEIGRTYLITNKIENALKILTAMPSQYPDHPVLAKVYFNLGDHYFRSQQYDNALRAFKLAIEDTQAVEVVPLAMRYLIRVHDSIRMWDAALGLTREYIRRFPNAEDILQKQVQIGIFYINLREYTRAAEYLKEVKRNADPETEAEIQYWIGKCFYNMGQFEQAIFEFLKVKYISKPTKLPWDTTALYEAGQAYLKLRKPEQARKLFRKVMQQEGATSDLGRIARQRIQEIDEGTIE